MLPSVIDLFVGFPLTTSLCDMPIRGGTWLGVTLSNDVNSNACDSAQVGSAADKVASTSLRWIAITNYREIEQAHRPSRGALVMEYLDGEQSASSFVGGLKRKGVEYNGFNLLVGDDRGIYYYGNRANDQTSAQPLASGVYGLSNGLLDSPWPKVERGKESMRLLCQKDAHEQSSAIESFHEDLMNILSDETQPGSDDQLPETGLDLSDERFLSSIFVPKGMFFGKDYGTRSSTTIVVDLDGRVSVLERTWYPERKDRWFRFDSKAGDAMQGMLVSCTP